MHRNCNAALDKNQGIFHYHFLYYLFYLHFYYKGKNNTLLMQGKDKNYSKVEHLYSTDQQMLYK